MKTKTKSTTNYVDNEALYKCIVSYKEKFAECQKLNKPIPKIPEFAGYCIDLIAKNMIKMANNRGSPAFLDYTFTEEMIADGVENCLLYFDNFDPNKTRNPFAYFSKIIYYAFLRRIEKEKKQLYFKYKTALNYGLFNSESLPTSDSDNSSFEMFDNLIDYIQKFEQKQKEKSEKQKEKIQAKKFLTANITSILIANTIIQNA